MNSAVLSEKKIDTLLSSYEDTERMMIGSDEHLDTILRIQESVRYMTKLTIDVNNAIEEGFNELDTDHARKIVIKLTSSIGSAHHFLSSLKSMPHIYEGIKTAYRELYVETKDLGEFIQDLIKYKINDPSDLRELLQAIK